MQMVMWFGNSESNLNEALSISDLHSTHGGPPSIILIGAYFSIIPSNFSSSSSNVSIQM